MNDSPAAKSVRLFPQLYLWIGPALTLRFLLLFFVYDWFVDDAYIFMRYAEHFAQGLGLVYNEGEKVMGFTSLTYTLITSLLKALAGGVSSSNLLAGLNLAAFALSGIPVFLLARGRPLGCCLLAVLLFYFPLVDATISGMESSIFMLFLAGTLLAAERGAWLWACAGGALAAATRPEGIFLLGPVVMLAFFRLPVRSWLAAMAVLAAAGALVLTALYLYYGTVIPHSVIAKSNLTNALRWAGVESSLPQKAVMLAMGASDSFYFSLPSACRLGLGVVTAAGLALGLSVLRRIVRRPAAGLAILFFLQVTAFYWTGNPVRIFSWYTVPTCACFWIAAFAGAEEAMPALRGSAAARWLAAGVLIVCVLSNAALPRRVRTISGQAGDLHRLGRTLKHDYPAGRSLMTADIGIIGYETGYRIIDLAGLVTPQAAAAPEGRDLSFGALVEMTAPDFICLKQDPLKAAIIVESSVRYRSFDDDAQRASFMEAYAPIGGSVVCPHAYVRRAVPRILSEAGKK